MNHLVKLITDDDGIETNDTSWHLVDPSNLTGPATLCTGESFGEGEAACEYEEKTAARGGITCPKCLARLKTLRAVSLD